MQMDQPFTVSEKMSEALGWGELLERLAELCHTERGQERARTLPLLEGVEAVEAELDLVGEARALHDQGDPPPFGAIWDLRQPLLRLQKEGTLEGPTLIQMAQTLKAGSQLSRFLRDRGEGERPEGTRGPGARGLIPEQGTRGPGAGGLARLAAGIAPLDGVSGPILDSFDEGGVLADHASDELGALRRALAELHERLVRRMRGLMEVPQIAKHLQDTFYTQREDRYVLPVRADAGPAVEGIVHGSSASGATIFIEPQEVVGLNNELKVAEIAVAREEARILTELSEMVGEEWEAIEKNLALLERLDVIDARARLATRLEAQRPRISRDGRLRLHGIRHPLMVLAGTRVIPNELELSAARALIISGPNAGGKTVCLKTLGLCALMARAGMHLPAGADSELPVYEVVCAEMGDDQSIEKNLSTFTAHLSHLQQFLAVARPGALILLDEIAVGTDPGEGAALAQAALEALVAAGAQVVVTTHYERLKSLAVADPRFANASVGFDLERLHPTYRLHLGVPGSSGALAVARRLGLPAAIVDRAAGLLDSAAQDLAALLTQLAGERTRLEAQREALAATTAEAEALVVKQRQTLEKAREKERLAVQGAFSQAVEELKRARQELERAQSLLRRPPSKERLEQADRQIGAAAAKIREHEPKSEAEGSPARPEDLRPGVRVVAPSLGGVGEVLEAPQRGKVAVRVGGIRAQVAVGELLLAPAGAAPSGPPRRREAPPERAPAQAPSERRTPIRTDAITLNVRGLRVDEALAETDKFIDHMLLGGEGVFFIIHGHGTGALRSALRSHLGSSELIDRIHPAETRDGGEGVTVVWLRG